MTRYTRLSAAVILEQRQRAMAAVCGVAGCGRPCAVAKYLSSGLVRMRRWCDRHRYARARPLSAGAQPRATSIPADVKVHPCEIQGCTQYAQVARAVQEIDGVLTPGWDVKPYCRRHAEISARPVGWVPRPRPTERGTQWVIRKFLGIRRWADRGHYDGTVYRVILGRVLNTVPAEAIADLRTQLGHPWPDRETLGAFAARYNLAVVAVVGATLAIREADGHGQD